MFRNKVVLLPGGQILKEGRLSSHSSEARVEPGELRSRQSMVECGQNNLLGPLDDYPWPELMKKKDERGEPRRKGTEI